jgi:hypothetical protein
VFASLDAREEFQADPIIVEVTTQRDGHNQYYNILEELTLESN